MSMGNLEGWIAFAAARGLVVPNDALSSQALVRAQDHVTNQYVLNFMEPHDEDSVGVEESVYEAAAKELAEVGFFSKVFTPAGQKVLTQVDKIKWTPIGTSSGSVAATPTLTTIESRLSRYIFDKDNFVGLSIDSIGSS